METPAPRKGYCEGDICSDLNKRIHTLIIKTKTYVIFLDDEFYVQWAEFEANKYAENYGEVMNRVSYLETISTTHFAGDHSANRELLEFRRLLGEAVARVYDGAGNSATSILDQAEQLLIDRSVQRARVWYLSAAASATLLPLLLLIILWLFRTYFQEVLGRQVFEVAICAALGGVGALVSTIIRVRKVNLNSSAGPLIHYIEGTARVIVGIIGGLLVALAIKSNILLGILNNSDTDEGRLAFLGCIALISGASEQMVPNLIARIETKVGSEGEKSGN
jgi:hypothetical protein